jgi:hypothetical protein
MRPAFRPVPLAVLLAVATLALTPLALQAQTELTGQSLGGAFYHIRAPEGWKPGDGLVIWNHGFSLSPPGPNPDLGPLVDVQLAEGYAVAASSYRLAGWAVFETHNDNRELLDAFEAEFGSPGQILVTGGSLGGIVTARDLEEGLLGNVVGALPICGALAGSRLWEGALDLRLLYDYVCGDVPGAAIPGGAEGLPFPLPPEITEVSLGLAINLCTGVTIPEDLRLPAQQARLDTLLQLTALPESFLLTDMGFATFALSDLVHDPAKLNGGAALGNAEVDYGDAAVDAGIARVTADPTARQTLFDNFTPTGAVGDVKIVSIHTDKDGLVLVENESAYASVVPAENLTTGIVVEDEPTHCGFNDAEVLAAWEALRRWVAGMPQPDVSDLQNACAGLVAGAQAEGPCRFDPGFVIPELDGRVRPRQTAPPPRDCVPDDTTLCLADGRFEVKVDWSTTQGTSGQGMAKPLTDDTGYFWFFDEDNVEMVIKVLDSCSFADRFWVFAGGLTNVEVNIVVTDVEKGVTKPYHNPQQTPFQPIQDTNAFATCP